MVFKYIYVKMGSQLHCINNFQVYMVLNISIYQKNQLMIVT